MQTFKPLGGSNYISAAYDYRDQSEHAATDNILPHSTHSYTKTITLQNQSYILLTTPQTPNLAFVSKSNVNDEFYRLEGKVL